MVETSLKGPCHHNLSAALLRRGREALERRRLLSGGGSDRTFATGGIFQAGDRTLDSAIVARQPDGKFVAAGPNAGGGISVAQFNSDGSEDASFGEHARVNCDLLPGSEEVLAVTPRPGAEFWFSATRAILLRRAWRFYVLDSRRAARSTNPSAAMASLPRVSIGADRT